MKKNALVVALAALGSVAYAGSNEAVAISTGDGDYITVAADGSLSASFRPFSWEVAAVYNYALTDIDEKRNTPSVDTYGVDVTGIYNFSRNHKFTLRMGYATGEQAGYDLTNFTFMPGYRYEKPISSKLAAFAGAGVGLGLSVLDTPGMVHRHHAVTKYDDMVNIVYSAEVGARYAVSRNLDIVGAVMFNGGTSAVHRTASFGNATEEQMSVGIRLGIGGQF